MNIERVESAGGPTIQADAAQNPPSIPDNALSESDAAGGASAFAAVNIAAEQLKLKVNQAFDDQQVAATSATTTGASADGIESGAGPQAVAGGGVAEGVSFTAVTNVGAAGDVAAVSAEFNGAVGRVEEAQAVVTALDEQLAADLAEFGSALSPAQQQEYITNFRFRNDYAGAIQELEDASRALAQLVESGKFDTLLNGAIARNGLVTGETRAAEQQLYEVLKTLAHTNYADVALRKTDFLLANNRDFRLTPFLESRRGQLRADIVDPATARVAGRALAETGGDARAAYDRFVEIIEPLNSVREVLVGRGDTGRAWESFKADLLSIAENQRPGGLTRIAGDWEARGRTGKSLVAVGMLFNAAVLGDAVTEPGSEFDRVAKALAQTGKDTLTLFSGAAATVARNAGDEAGALAGGARLAAKLLPGLGLAANLASLSVHGRELREDPDAGLVISVIADAFAVAGSVLEVFPPTAFIGAPLATVSELISSAGEVLSVLISGDEDKARRREMLLSLSGENSLDPLVVDTFLTAGKDRLDDLRELGLSPHQIQALAHRYGGVSLFSQQVGLDGFAEMTRVFGLSPRETYDLLMAVGGDGQYVDSGGMSNFLGYLSQKRDYLRLSPEQFRQVLARDIDLAVRYSGAAGINAESVPAFQRVLDFLNGRAG